MWKRLIGEDTHQLLNGFKNESIQCCHFWVQQCSAQCTQKTPGEAQSCWPPCVPGWSLCCVCTVTDLGKGQQLCCIPRSQGHPEVRGRCCQGSSCAGLDLRMMLLTLKAHFAFPGQFRQGGVNCMKVGQSSREPGPAKGSEGC